MDLKKKHVRITCLITLLLTSALLLSLLLNHYGFNKKENKTVPSDPTDHGHRYLKQLASTYCETRGLSNYPDHEHVGGKLRKCLGYAAEHVPTEAENSTEIHLGGTAGLRLLQSENVTAADVVMQALRREIQNTSSFLLYPENVRIISGEEEGFYGWTSANYLADSPQKNTTVNKDEEEDLYGVLQLGGASTQITFRPTKTVANSRVQYRVSADLFGEEMDLYSQSFLCHGLKEADRAYHAMLVAEQQSLVVFDPCLPAGGTFPKTYDQLFGRYCTNQHNTSFRGEFFFIGTSDSVACRKGVQRLFRKAACPHPDDQCSFNGIYRPKLTGKFLAFSGYFFTMKFFNLIARTHSTADTVSLLAFRNATAKHCGKTWDQLDRPKYTKKERSYLMLFCFNAHYIDTILTRGYGFTEENFGNIKFRKDVKGTEFGWALGYALNVTLSRNLLRQHE